MGLLLIPLRGLGLHKLLVRARGSRGQFILGYFKETRPLRKGHKKIVRFFSDKEESPFEGM